MNVGVDVAISQVASRQHGLIAREQLARLALGREARRTRERRRQLHPVPGCPGVFAVGHPTLGEEATIHSVVLACGRGSYAAGEHAEWLWELRPPWLPFPSLPVSVIVPRGCGRNPPAARVLRRDPPGAEWQRRRGIPVVSVERLIADARSERELWAVERLLDRALLQRLTSVASLERQLERAKGQRGVLALRTLLAAERRYAGLTRSALEEAFLLLLGRAGLALPEVNAQLGEDVVNALFALARVVVGSTARGGTGPAAARSRIAGRSCDCAAGACSSCGTRRGRCSRSPRRSSRISSAFWLHAEGRSRDLCSQAPRFHAG